MFDMFGEVMDSTKDIKYPDIPEYKDDVKLKKEKEIIGAYIWESPLDKHLDKFESYNISSQDLEELEEEVTYDEDGNEIAIENKDSRAKDNMQAVFGGIISDVKKVYTKRDNKEMAIVKVEDLYGTMDIMIFNKQWEVIKNKVTVDNMATFKGKLSIRDGERPIIIISSVEFWQEEESQQTLAQSKVDNIAKKNYPKLYLKFDCQNEKLKSEVIEILKHSAGGHSLVTIVCEKTRKKLCYKNIKIDTRLLSQLEVYIKPECMVVK
jgi:DNA polymerase-3 subunit alpha